MKPTKPFSQVPAHRDVPIPRYFRFKQSQKANSDVLGEVIQVRLYFTGELLQEADKRDTAREAPLNGEIHRVVERAFGGWAIECSSLSSVLLKHTFQSWGTQHDLAWFNYNKMRYLYQADRELKQSSKLRFSHKSSKV